MIRSRGDSVRTDTRIALIGAQSPEGQRVKRVLETLQVDGERVNLFGACAGDAVMSDYDGAARLIQEADRAAIDGHGLVFLCETDSFTERFLDDPGPSSVALDLTGVGYQNKSIDLVHDRLLGQLREFFVVGGMPEASDKSQAMILQALALIGSDEALLPVVKAAHSDNPDLRKEAVKQLSNWSNDKSLPVLLEIAGNTSAPLAEHVLAIRGIKSQLASQKMLNTEVALQAQALCRRDQERQQFADLISAAQE